MTKKERLRQRRAQREEFQRRSVESQPIVEAIVAAWDRVMAQFPDGMPMPMKQRLKAYYGPVLAEAPALEAKEPA